MPSVSFRYAIHPDPTVCLAFRCESCETRERARQRFKTTTLSDRSGWTDHRAGVDEGSLGQIFRRAILWLPHVRRLRAIIRFDDNSSSTPARLGLGDGRRREKRRWWTGRARTKRVISYDRTQLHAESLMERFEPGISWMPWKAIAT